MPAITPKPSGDYQVCPVYVGNDGVDSTAAFLLPPAYLFNEPIKITLQLPWVAATVLTGERIRSGDFALAFTRVDQKQRLVEATVAVSANVWKASATERQKLASNFVAFVTAVESQLESGAAPLLAPGASAFVAQQIAEQLPAPLHETLFYRFGYVSGFGPGGATPYVDLRPGMRLRIEPEASQFVAPGAAANGYVAQAPLTVELCTVADPGPRRRKLAFGPFFGATAAPEIAPMPSTRNLVVASGLIDLQRSGLSRHYWRLFAPRSMAAGHTPGDLGLEHNAVLVGADTLADLGDATAAMANANRVEGTSAVYALLRGRAVAAPEIAVTLSMGGVAQTIWVQIGTTVAQLLERVTDWKPWAIDQRVLSMKRITTDSNQRALAYVSVNFRFFSVEVNDLRAFDLPLVRGDVVTVEIREPLRP